LQDPIEAAGAPARILSPPTMHVREDNLPGSDEALVARLQSGEIDRAMTELEARYGKRIYHVVQGMLRDAHLAHDVTPEVF
jgi:hypothetical protein